MGDEQEIITLLREIRDLQRAHFEKYQEFTAAALKRQEEAVKRQEDAIERQRQSAANTAQARDADQQYRVQVQQRFADTARSSARAQIAVWVSIILQTALIFALGCIILILLHRP